MWMETHNQNLHMHHVNLYTNNLNNIEIPTAR